MRRGKLVGQVVLLSTKYDANLRQMLERGVAVERGTA